ncbi:DUF5103 domain-containing protein [Pedobacter sp.]|uniref:type IX secretion system plug protein n=1 Tax=Pedobacter sp. TaxID=1411316 RepID=UPI003D7F4765
MMIMGRLLFLLLACTQFAMAQQSQLQTVQCYNAQKEQSLPVIALSSTEQLLFSFDDLQGGSKNYSYAVEHYTADWQPSGLSTVDYVMSFAGDRLTDFQYSSGTLQKYTHYNLTLPNEQVKFKISGNYLLKVYENGNTNKPLLSQRFYVVDNKVYIKAEVKPTALVEERNSSQKVNFTIAHPQLSIQQPQQDLKIRVMQNGNPHSAIVNNKPSFVQPGLLTYNDLQSYIFKGGNEFRKFDTRSLRSPGAQVKEILKDSLTTAVLLTDQSRHTQKYSSQFDENGIYYIRNQDGRDNQTESDYVNVQFTLKAPLTQPAEVYVYGRFNDFRLDQHSKLHYNAAKKSYQTNLLLKQGVYDYQYVSKDAATGMLSSTSLEGSFYETGNTYQVFVYFRKPGSRYDQLIGYFNTQTDTLLPSQ